MLDHNLYASQQCSECIHANAMFICGFRWFGGNFENKIIPFPRFPEHEIAGRPVVQQKTFVGQEAALMDGRFLLFKYQYSIFIFG